MCLTTKILNKITIPLLEVKEMVSYSKMEHNNEVECRLAYKQKSPLISERVVFKA
jgi:hypothetical protein